MNHMPTPDDPNWKEYWRQREKDKAHQNLTRVDKKKARKRFHKKNRRDAKQILTDQED